MEKLYEYVKTTVVTFKLDSCFCVAPIRPGLMCIGYLNIFMSLLFLVATADETFNPPLMSVQAIILEDQISKPLGIVAYGTEMVFNVLLLAGLYRNDVTLLRVYIYFVVGSIVSSVLVYSIVFAAIVLLIQIYIILILVFQCYVIVLTRSVIVEIKEARASEKNGHVTLYSVVQMPEDGPNEVVSIQTVEPKPAIAHSTVEPKIASERIILDPKTTVEIQDSKKEEHQKTEEDVHSEEKKEEPITKLATINEHVKDVTEK